VFAETAEEIELSHRSEEVWVAIASRDRGLSVKDCFGETPKPTREMRALPDPFGVCDRAGTATARQALRM